MASKDDAGSNHSDGEGDTEAPSGPRPEVKQGGWGSDQPKVKRAHDHLEKDEMEDERFKMTAPQPDSDDEEEAGAIPDMDRMKQQEEAQQVAEAPAATIQMSTMAELDKDLSYQAPFAHMEDGIDLRLLTDALVPKEQIYLEKDVKWEFEQLFTEVKSELETESEATKDKPATEDEQTTNDLPL